MTQERVAPEALAEFRMTQLGPVLTAEDEGYDEARKSWNGYYDHRSPGVIARCLGVADVQGAVRFARANDLTVAVRGGGHSSSGASSIEGGILIDLSLMRGVRVDPVARTAVAAAGSLLQELDRETSIHGLAVTAGTVSHTGIAGLTLFGGIGRLMRKHGLTCDNVLAFDLVTADGAYLHVDADHHPDLFWALRGGGGTLGIVTHFTYQLHALDPIVYGGYLGWPLDQAKDVYTALQPLIDAAPEDLQVQYIFTTGPIADFIPEPLQAKPCLMMTATWVGEDRAAGAAYLKPFQELVPPLLNMVGEFPYTMLQSASDPLAPHGRWNVGSLDGFLDGVTPELFDAAIEQAGKFPVLWSFIEFSQLGGAVARVPEEENAARMFRGAAWLYIAGGNTLTEDEVTPIREWTAETDGRFRPLARPGRYPNFLTDDEPEQLREALGAETYDRLMEIKATYDPDAVFSHNPNKRPIPQTA